MQLIIVTLFVASASLVDIGDAQDLCEDSSDNCAANKFQCETHTFTQNNCKKTCNRCNNSQGWSQPNQGCIRHHNDKVVDGIYSMHDCQAECESLGYECKSAEWHMWGRCVLSKTDTRDALSVFEAPCRGDAQAKQWVYSERRNGGPPPAGPPPAGPPPASPPAPEPQRAPFLGPIPVRAHQQGSPPQVSGSSNDFE